MIILDKILLQEESLKNQANRCKARFPTLAELQFIYIQVRQKGLNTQIYVRQGTEEEMHPQGGFVKQEILYRSVTFTQGHLEVTP